MRNVALKIYKSYIKVLFFLFHVYFTSSNEYVYGFSLQLQL